MNNARAESAFERDYRSAEEVFPFLGQMPPFRILDSTTLRKITESVSIEFYQKGALILRHDDAPGNHMRIVRKGRVKVAVKNGAEDVSLEYRSNGDAFGIISMNCQDRSIADVTAIEETCCYFIPESCVGLLIDICKMFDDYFAKAHLGRGVDLPNSNFPGLDSRIDRILFTTRIGDLEVKKPILVGMDFSIQEAARLMAKGCQTSLIITDNIGSPVGIVTERDFCEKVVATGRNITEPIGNIKNLSLVRTDVRNDCFDAVLKMIRHNSDHIMVVEDGRLKRVLSNHNFLQMQGGMPLALAKDIESLQSIEELASLTERITRVIRLLLKEGITAGNITRIISELNDRLVKKILEIAERKFGKPPFSFCWVVLGSEGRKEQVFKTNQEHALIYADPTSQHDDKLAREFFQSFALFVSNSLVKIGYPSCPTGDIAKNPMWCQPISVWEKYFHSLIHSNSSEAIRRSLIFFDFRPLYGALSLAEVLRSYLVDKMKGANVYLSSMMSAVSVKKPFFGFFRAFVHDKFGEHRNEINISSQGINPLVNLVRLLSLESAVSETSTLERISAMRHSHPIVSELGAEIERIFEFMMLMQINNQLRQAERGIKPNNYIDPRTLSSFDKRMLKECFYEVSRLQDSIIRLRQTEHRYA